MRIHFKNMYQGPDAEEHVMPLQTKEDFHHIVEVFPQLAQSLYRYNDLRKVAQDMVSYLGSHHIRAWLTED